MLSAEGNGDQFPNAAVLPNGELWFPTTRGVVIVDPLKLREHDVRPPIVIEEVKADEQMIFRDGGYTRSAESALRGGTLRLGPGRGRLLEIRYTACTFTGAEKTRFRYRLEGSDPDWQEADTRRVALYTGLHPGRYWFRVEACNDHGYWSVKPAELRFQIDPFFYETRPFYILCALAVGGLLVAWHLSRLSTLRRVQQLEQAQLLYKERSRIAKDLHDDLGANLTGIALQLELSRREVPTPPLRQQLENAIGSIRSLIDSMREVVWSLDPECDSLESFCAYVCQRAEEFLEAAGLRHRFDMPQLIPAMTLTAENRHHLLLIVREALNNVVKHAKATEVQLKLQIDERSLDLAITDNGIGFKPPSEADNGGGTRCGLLNMRQRVEALGGTFGIASATGRGTRITCVFPLPLASASRTLPSHVEIHSSSAG